jgi:16S rRNA (guanine527-N7)-methyltransferase
VEPHWAFHVKREIEAKLARYEELVRAWSAPAGLVGPADLDSFSERHIADSLRLLPLLGELPQGPAVDVGSGAGLPGVPLAVAGPERPWRLLEPRRKRATFLEEVVRELELDCEVVMMSAQEAAATSRLAHAHVLATARALARPGVAAALLTPLLRADGVCAIFVGARAKTPPQAEEWTRGIAIMRATAAPDWKDMPG